MTPGKKKLFFTTLRRNKFIQRILSFFPVQLFFVHLKNNPILFIIWSVLIAIISKSVLAKYGVPYLFLTPEYLGKVSYLSYFILGISFGGFLMAFNISSYIINGHRFPFIATLSRPFFKYTLNNISWALILIGVYLYFAIDQLLIDKTATSDIFIYLAGFTGGIFVIALFVMGYFINTNKSFSKLFGTEPTAGTDNIPQEKSQKATTPIKGVFHKKVAVDDFFNRDREWNTKTYLSSFSKIGIARSIEHYDSNMLKEVFQQNHFNAALFEIAAIFSIVLLTFGSDLSYFNIPAGASLMLMFTVFIMLTSAIHSWFRGWASAILIGLFLLINFLSQFPTFNAPNQAYGLNYKSKPAKYSTNELKKINSKKNYQKDFFHGLKILEKWKNKNNIHSSINKTKPKMVFINTTGGGMRSSMWSMYCMQYVDSVLNGELLNHTQLISGSSGGMVGMAYLRELYLQEQVGKINNLYATKYVQGMSKDILNRVGFMMCVNDALVKVRYFDDGTYSYVKDRGYAFEQQLNINTNNLLNKRLGDYYLPELNANIPMMVISPTITSDGRRLLISPQPISYLSYPFPKNNINNNVLIESVEFNRFFKNQNANNLKFTSALRMTSTFPYIMPIVHLPSSPPIEVMDSGLRDNFGTKTSLKFLYTFKNWIEANTSGVVIIQIRDMEKKSHTIQKTGNNTLLESISSPVGNIYKNLFIGQDYDHDQMIQYASEWFDGTIDVIDFSIENNENNQLSLSWHLTENEKKKVYQSILSESNQKSLAQLKKLLNGNEK